MKVSTINDLNDPFEALSCSLPEPSDRKHFKKLKNQIHMTWGIQCFSESWSNPLLWSNYGDRHKGICLRFEIPKGLLIKVKYTKKRDDLSAVSIRRSDIHRVLLSRKYHDWAFEKEWRTILRLKDLQKEQTRILRPFSQELSLDEIIVGPMCSETDASLRKILHDCIGRVRFTKARMAFRSFRVVTNRKGFAMLDRRRIQTD